MTYNFYVQTDATEILYLFLRPEFQRGIRINIPRNGSELL